MWLIVISSYYVCLMQSDVTNVPVGMPSMQGTLMHIDAHHLEFQSQIVFIQ